MTGKELELMHYASANYDPVKAHEYYVRNRNLKGVGKSTKDLTKEQIKSQQETNQRQTEARMYVRNQLSTKQKAERETQDKEAAIKNSAIVKAAEAASKSIQEKLAAHLAMLDTQLKVPENASPKVRAFLEKQHAKQKASAVGATRAKLGAIRKNLQTEINVARNNYAAARAATTKKYQDLRITEDKNIRNEVR